MVTYVAGWNMPGYLPESEPWHTDNYVEAVDYLLDEMSRYGDMLEGSEYDEYLDAVSNAEMQRASGVEVFVPLGDCIYWVTTQKEGM